ncbi:MAG: serine O-acetyltransferase, partial [Gaiellaceae bacterium]
MFGKMRHDIRAVKERDPAARNWLEVVLCYPGLWAVWWHRVAHVLWRWRLRLLARWISQLVRGLTGIEIHPGAVIGRGLFIDHGMGVVIGETAEIGDDVTLYQGVTLGGTSLEKGKRHPTLGDGVVVGAGAKVLGAITIGEYSRVGANAVVVKPVPACAVVVGVPGEIVTSKETRPKRVSPNLEHGLLPDVLGDAVADLVARVDELERQIEGGVPHHE